MASRASTYQGLGILGPILAITVIFVKFTFAFSRSLYQMMVFAVTKVGEIQTERKANRVMQEMEAAANRTAAQEAGAPAASDASEAAAASTPASGNATGAARSAARATSETAKPAKAAVEESVEAPVSWPQAADTAPKGTTRSGKQGAELEVADRHLLKTMGGKTIKFSLYRASGKVERFDVKAKVRLQPYLKAMADKSGVEFSMEAAQHFTEKEIAAARQQKRGGKAPDQATPKASQQQASDAAGHADVPMSSQGEEPPPYMEVPPDVQMGYEPNYASTTMDEPSSKQTSNFDEPGYTGDSMIVDGETDYERTVYQGTILKMEMVKRRPTGKKAFEIFEMALKLDGDGERKVFAGVELAEKKLSLGLKLGDQISIQKGVHHFEVVTDLKREARIKNVFSIKVISRKERRVSGYARAARG